MHNGQITSTYNNRQWTIGGWQEVPAPANECEGLHCYKNITSIVGCIDMDVLAEVEIDGARINEGDMITVQRMRIINAWLWRREDNIALTAISTELYLILLEKSGVLTKAHSKNQIKAAKKFIDNPTYGNMVSGLNAKLGGAWAHVSIGSAISWYLANASSNINRLGDHITDKDIKQWFFKRLHRWVVKHTKIMERPAPKNP